MTVELAAILLAWLAIVLLGFALAGVLRQLHDLRAQLGRPASGAGPQAGRSLPGELSTVTGLLLFASKTCGACAEVLPEAARIASTHPDWTVALLYRGEPGRVDVPGLRVRAGEDALFDALGITVTPFAVIVDAGKVVVAAPTGSPAALRALAERHEQRENANAVAA